MAEILRITGKNNIRFDVVGGGNYNLNKPPRGLSKVLTRREVLSTLPRLPLGIRSHALKYGLSVIILDFNIWDTTDTLMEDKEHDLLETLFEGQLYIESQQGWGSKAELQYKTDAATGTSYKTVLYGVVDELDARDILGPKIRGHRLEGLRLTLYCEPYWHPNVPINLALNVTLYNHDDAAHNNYTDIAAGVILGDVPSPIYVTVFPVKHPLMILRVFARHKGTITNFVSAYEAEIAGSSGRLNWPDVVDPDSSGGAYIGNNAGTPAGYVWWTIAANKPDQEGTFHLFARVWTDDYVNTRFRARLTNALGWPAPGTGQDLAVGKWKALDENSVWKFIDLGQFTVETPYGLARRDWRWYIDYAKDASDLAYLDWMFIAPVDEGIGLLLDVPEEPVAVADGFFWRSTHDFVKTYVWDPGGSEYMQPLIARGFGPEPVVMPQEATRLFFSVDAESATGLFQNWVHDGGNDERFTVSVQYLPQFISPLE